MAQYKQKYKNKDFTPFGKVPPQDVALENQVLGALLIQSDAIYEIIDLIKVETFYEPCNQIIYKAILELNASNKAIDIMTISTQLKNNDELDSVGGEVYISELTDRVATSAHIIEHSRIIHELYLKREFIKMSMEIQQKAFDPSIDIEELIEYSELTLYNLTDINVSADIKQVSVIAKECVDDLETRCVSEDRLTGTPTGFSEVDRVTAGLQQPDLIIVAARPAMGKSSFAVAIGRNMAIDFNESVAIFSLEMSSKQTVDRIIIADAEVDSSKYRTGQLGDLDWSRIENATSKIENAKLFIDDTASISIFELRSKCRKLKRQHGLGCVIIDYLQLMTAGSDFKGNRESEVSFISRSLKALAKELQVPVVALSQLNRAVESRAGDKRPQLSDLRESGAIEQDADVVMFLHRPEYYGILEDSDGNSTKGIAEVVIAKYRNGATGIIKLRFIKNLIKFTDLIKNDFQTVFPSSMLNNNDITQNEDFLTDDTNTPF